MFASTSELYLRRQDICSNNFRAGGSRHKQGVRMKLLRQSAAATGFAAMLLLGGCAHHNQMASTTSSDVGTISPDAARAAGVIPGPAKVDSSGNVYTSSAAPGSGASLNDGTNTNVNIIPA